MKITAKAKETSFVPHEINISITIESKEELKRLNKEFKEADLEENDIESTNSSSGLPIMSRILKEIETEL